MRKILDGLYLGAAALAAFFLLSICVLMLAQSLFREIGIQIRGADDLTAWFCAAAAFLPLAYTFRQGELIRVGLLLENLSHINRKRAEIFSLLSAAIVVGYMTWAVSRFVHESYTMNEMAQGLLLIPIWIPQLSFLIGVAVLFIAVIDELTRVLLDRKPTYRIGEEERLARGEFGDGV
jgi:TRAP-type C4-dicarboxylate transport system permease small subunit